MRKAKPVTVTHGDGARSGLRRFYADWLAVPILYAIPCAVFITGLTFLFRWAGWRGKFKPWGDPISLTEALSKVPLTFAMAFVMSLAFFIIWEYRSPGHKSD